MCSGEGEEDRQSCLERDIRVQLAKGRGCLTDPYTVAQLRNSQCQKGNKFPAASSPSWDEIAHQEIVSPAFCPEEVRSTRVLEHSPLNYCIDLEIYKSLPGSFSGQASH